jgi:hypothetical protein
LLIDLIGRCAAKVVKIAFVIENQTYKTYCHQTCTSRFYRCQTKVGRLVPIQ